MVKDMSRPTPPLIDAAPFYTGLQCARRPLERESLDTPVDGTLERICDASCFTRRCPHAMLTVMTTIDPGKANALHGDRNLETVGQGTPT
jgi:hypothetical protein